MNTRSQHSFCRRAVWLAAPVAALALAAPLWAHHLEKHFTVDGRPVISIQSRHGRIAVKSWKKSEVVVVGDHSSPRVEVDTEQAGNRIEVVTHTLSDNLTPTEMEANYQITVPEESELQVRTDSGTIVVERVYGDMVFDTVAGDLQLEDVSGHLLVTSITGSLACTRCLGQINASTISGNVQFFQPAMDNVKVKTMSGNILFDGEFMRRGIYTLNTGTGNIEVRFSDSDSFDLKATSVQGVVKNDAHLLPDPHGRRYTYQPPQDGPSRTFIGTFNDGHAKVELSSFSGTIRIRKRD